VLAVAFYVLIKIVFVGKKSFKLIKMHGKTTIKIRTRYVGPAGRE
jgi:hypothetical protein